MAAETSLNLPDAIQPNADGYQVVARTVLAHLRPLLDGAASSAAAAVGQAAATVLC